MGYSSCALRSSSSLGSSGSLRSSSSLGRDARGAMIIMGIPMAMLMIGFLYFVIGLGEQIVMRERLQDAADSGAFSAAIMHARGMNMIALVNQVMAAIVALLVMVRLLQAVMIAVAAVGAALAFWTAGASLAVVPPATYAAVQAENAFQQLRNFTTPILRGLHVFELGLKYGMPIAAQARVVTTVTEHYSPPATVGFAIPGHYPLPVEDGQWRELCGHAGRYAADMIMWPFNEILGDNPVAGVLGDGISGLASACAVVFCSPDAGGSPDLEIPDELPDVQLDQSFERGIPESDAVRRCNSREGEDRLMTLAQREEACELAAIDEGRARPGGDGRPNTDCRYTSPRTLVEDTPCPPCRGADDSVCEAFSYRAARAANECRPGGPNVASTWTYQRRDFTWRMNLVPVPLAQPEEGEELTIPDDEDRRYTLELTTDAPDHEDSGFYQSPIVPCGPGGVIATSYNASSTYHDDGEYESSEMLCEQAHLEPDTDAWIDEAGAGTDGLTLSEWRDRFEHATWIEENEPYAPARPADWDEDDAWPPPWLQPPYVTEERSYFVGRWAAATYLQACTVHVETPAEIDIPDEDGSDEDAEQPREEGSCGGGEQVHHRMEPGHELGDETFQLRAIVIGDTQSHAAREVVERVPFRVRGQERGAGSLVSDALGLAGRVFVAQAEYYYDTTWNEEREELEHGPEHWMWNMSWRARLRRFRLPRESDDSSGESDSGGESCDFGAPNLDLQQACDVAGGDACGAVGGGFLEDLQDFAETVMVH